MTKQNYMICNSGEDDSTIFMDLDENEANLVEDVFNRLNNSRNRYAPTVSISPVIPKGELVKIWTMVYRPFINGGDVNTPVFTMVHIAEKRAINGFDFFSFKTPRGSLRICEAKTGGIVGDSFEGIEKSIAGVPIEMLLKQIDDAKPFADSAEEQSNEEFFSKYRY